ncbi:MAG: transcriptional repressor [Proteobacteria bacterium]|nr:transcriptional repressor [Pseudomonadota bacterium]
MTPDPVLAPFPTKRHDHAHCVAAAIAAAEEVCARAGATLTPLRRRVLELVWTQHRPVRAYGLLERLRDERRGAAPPTVYRALDFLIAHGLVHRIESLNAFIGCGDPRNRHGGQFLICRACGHVAELDDAGIARKVAERAKALGFLPEVQTIEIAGLCPACQDGSTGTTHAA